MDESVRRILLFVEHSIIRLTLPCGVLSGAGFSSDVFTDGVFLCMGNTAFGRVTSRRRCVVAFFIGTFGTWQAAAAGENPRRGYSIVIGCNTPLAEMLGANLKMIERQRLENLDRIFHRARSAAIGDALPDRICNCARAFDLPLRFVYYTDHQSETARKVGQPWVYAWLSWCLGIAAARTRYCFLHDFDTRC